MASLLTARNNKRIDFGLIFFSSSEASAQNDKYRLVIESAKFADQHDFSAIWIPERHFTKDGWLYPNPAILHAALARETHHIRLQAGSVVLPLHSPLRVAEEWSVVDNLSGGRVGIAFASGWHPNDFALAPANYEKRQEIMFRDIDTVQRLWRGEKVQVTGGDGKQVELQTYPTPIQRELPFWITAAGNPNTFAKAGAIGANLLTHMYNQSIPELTEKINIYRQARAEHGYDPETGQVSVLLHTFIGKDKEIVRQQIQGPFSEYLKSASYLVNAIAYSRGQKIDLNTLSAQDLEDYLHFVTDRLISTQRVLIGTPEDCLEQVLQIKAAGVTEIACQMDFGISTDLVMENLPYLNQLKDEANVRLQQQPTYEREHISISATHRHTNGHKPESQTHSSEKSVPGPDTDFSLGTLLQRCHEQVDLTDFYQTLQQHGIQLAENFQGIKRLWQGDKEALGQIKLANELIQDANAYTIHPTLLDASLQVLIAALPHDLFTSVTDLYLPTGIRSFQMYQPLSTAVWSYAQLTTAATASSEVIEGDVRILNDQGQLLVEALGLQLQHTSIATSVPSSAAIEPATTEFEQWLYELQWQSSTLKEPDPALLTGNWLIFADKSGIGQRFIEQLDKYGAHSTRVTAGKRYRKLAPGHYQIDPMRPEDTQRIIQEATQKQHVQGIIHLWSLDTTPVAATSIASLEDDQLISTQHVLQLIQTLAQQNSTKQPHLWLITRGAQAVTSENEQLELSQAPLWGLGKTCAMEHPEFWGGLLDLDPEETARRAASQLLSGISSYTTEDQIAFRGNQSYVARMVRSQARAAKKLTYYKDASYLITGGLWGLGLEIARRFAEKGAGHLILLGRSELPPRSSWDTLPVGSRQAIQTTGIRTLERLGAQVHYAAVDVADEAQLANFLTNFVQQGHPPLRGIIHAASVWQDAHGQSLVRPLAQIQPEELTAVFRPKVIGSWLLYSLTRSYALDFFVSFSSGASLFGSAAQGNYAAAGEFMDILAHYQRAHGQPALSIDWGAISEIGFGGTAEGKRVHEYWESRGIQRINPRQVLDTLEVLIPQGIARIGVIKLDWQLLEQFYAQIAGLPLVRHLVSHSDNDTQASSAQTSSILETIRAARAEQWTSILEDYLRTQVAGVLRLSSDQLDNEQPLTAFGLDSLMAIELKNRLESELALRIPIVTFLQGPSIIQFAQQIRQQLSETIIANAGAPSQTNADPYPGTVLPSQDTEQLLAQLDQLSDQDVDTLLAQMLPEEHEQRSNGHNKALPDLHAQDAAVLLAQIDQLSDEQVDSLLNEIAQKEDLNR